MKHFYAIYDATVRESNPGHGFCNTKKAVAFDSKTARDEFLAERSHYDFTAKKITRAQAKEFLEPIFGDSRKKGLPLNSPEAENYYTLWESSL